MSEPASSLECGALRRCLDNFRHGNCNDDGMKTHLHHYACLPFVEIAHEAIIQMGPVSFWPASSHAQFRSYLDTIHAPSATTCISIAGEVPADQREFLLIDALYLLYFTCTFRNLYNGTEILPFEPFRKMIPGSLEFIEDPSNWKSLEINAKDRNDAICLHLFYPELCQAFGSMLTSIYTTPETNEGYKRMIRSIRYLVDRFFPRFVNLLGQGLAFSEALFEPEDIIYLASAFESLFNIDEKDPVSDLKHKLRPLLHLKYSKPLELFWKWVHDFYNVKKSIIHGGTNPDPLFRGNPNFEVSHVLIATKLFIYSVYSMLFKFHLLESKTSDPYTPPDFRWIHPEEVLLFFWTEVSLLRKMHLFIPQFISEPDRQNELHSDVIFLTHLFTSMQERFYQKEAIAGVRFIPTPEQQIEGFITHILNVLESVPKDGVLGQLCAYLKPRK